MKNLRYSIVPLLVVVLFSCTSSKKKKIAEGIVSNFYSAVQVEDEKTMFSLYPGIVNLDSYYKSDSSKILESEFYEGKNIRVKTRNYYTNGYGKKFTNQIIFYLTPDSLNDLNYSILDTKGLCGYDDNKTFEFARKIGLLELDDTSDQIISIKLDIAESFLEKKNSELYLELLRDVEIVQWSWQSGYASSASGKGIIKNNSSYNLPDIKYEITYYDRYDNTTTTDDGYLLYDGIKSGQSKSFTFYSSYIGNASKASLNLVFDTDKLKDFLLEKDYTGDEFQEYINSIETNKPKTLLEEIGDSISLN